MNRPSQRTTKVVAALATPVALVAAGVLVFQASNAAFTGQTRNSGNEWSTGSVNLTDDDNGQARFQVTNMLPGQTETKCVKVTANASVPSLVKGYTVNPVTSVQGLEDHIDITVRSGDGGTFADCTGFVSDGEITAGPTPLSTLAQANTYETGIGGWDVAGGAPESKTYQFTWTFDTTGLTQSQIDQLQGAKTGIDVQWEMRSN